MLKIGLTQRVEEFAAAGERRDCLDQAWSELLVPLGYLPAPLPNAIADEEGVDALVTALGLDGVILTGGNDLADAPGARNAAPERDRFERLLIDVCGRRNLPVLGVCRGLQLLVCHAGGTLVMTRGHAGTRHALRADGGGAMPLSDREEVNSYHDFALDPDSLGRDFEAVARAADGSVEAIVHRRLPIWGIMWHPEREPRDPRDTALLRALFGEASG